MEHGADEKRLGTSRWDCFAKGKRENNLERKRHTYPYGSDLHWLSAWGDRIDRWLIDEKLPNRHFRGIYLPDGLASDAITRLCDRFPAAFQLILSDLKEVDTHYKHYLQPRGESEAGELSEAMERLRDRIRNVVGLVADGSRRGNANKGLGDRGDREDIEHTPSLSDTATTSTHSQDFTSVNWYGTRYRFAKGNQAQAVSALWEAWRHGQHGLSQETIREQIGSSADCFDLRKTFRLRANGSKYKQHPAWGTMIQPDGKGCYRLVRPKSA